MLIRAVVVTMTNSCGSIRPMLMMLLLLLGRTRTYAVPLDGSMTSITASTAPASSLEATTTPGLLLLLMSRPTSTARPSAAAADVGDEATAARRTVRVAPPWRHMAAAKNTHWNLPPPAATSTTTTTAPPPPDGRRHVARPKAPSFGRVPPVIDVWPGHTVILSCVVHDLGDRMVSWIRTSDLQILTAGPHRFTSDARISVDFEAAAAAASYDENAVDGDDDDDEDDDEDDDDDVGRAVAPLSTTTSWPLTIRQVRHSDVGLYECQINTEPKLKTNVTLLLHEPQLADLPFAGVTIDGARDPVVAAGTNIRLVCRSPPAPPIQHHQLQQKPQPQQQLHPLPQSDSSDTAAVGPLVTWLLDGRPLSGVVGVDEGGEEEDQYSGHGETVSAPGGGRRRRPSVGRAAVGGVNVLTELSPTGIVSALTLAAATELDGGAYECRVRDVGADAVNVQVVRKGTSGGGGADEAATSGIIVQPWSLSDAHTTRQLATPSAGTSPAMRFGCIGAGTAAFQRLLWLLVVATAASMRWAAVAV